MRQIRNGIAIKTNWCMRMRASRVRRSLDWPKMEISVSFFVSLFLFWKYSAIVAAASAHTIRVHLNGWVAVATALKLVKIKTLRLWRFIIGSIEGESSCACVPTPTFAFIRRRRRRGLHQMFAIKLAWKHIFARIAARCRRGESIVAHSSNIIISVWPNERIQRQRSHRFASNEEWALIWMPPSNGTSMLEAQNPTAHWQE